MRILVWVLILPLLLLQNCLKPKNQQVKIVIIRHAEKEDQGDNLNCKGFSRSVLLPAVLFQKYGRPRKIFIPAVGSGESTRHGRMFQTISPFVIKYNMAINSIFEENDGDGVAKALLHERGTVFVVWDHKFIQQILEALGVSEPPGWKENDYDSIWVITIDKGRVSFVKDREGLTPAATCNF
jgi:hypothetical protein